MLGKVHRNRIYDFVVKSGLDPAEFKLTVTTVKAVISHVSGSTYEAVRKSPKMREAYSRAVGAIPVVRDRYVTKAIVADGSQKTDHNVLGVHSLMTDIREWVDEVGQVAKAPDYWAEMQSNRKFIAGIQRKDSGNAPFTQDEQRQIAAQLQEMKKQVRAQFELTSEQIAQVDEKLDEAAEASKRMGRKDWLIYFLGTTTALIITATVIAGVGEHIFNVVIHGLANLFTDGSIPPQIPPGILA